MRRTHLLARAAIAAALMMFAVPAGADTISFDWTTSNPNVVAGQGTFGNSRSLTVGSVKVTASAWGYTYPPGSGNNAFEAAALGAWTQGLGVCNAAEDGNTGNPPACGSPGHAVGNVFPSTTQGDDFVLFLFSTPDGTPLSVDPTSVTISTFGASYDRDVSYWLGNVSAPLNLTGVTYANLSSLGFGARIDNSDVSSPDGSGDPYARTVSLPPTGAPFYNALLFGAQVEPGGGEDYFKIASMTLETAPPPAVPEPATLVLLGLGAAGIRAARWVQQRRPA